MWEDAVKDLCIELIPGYVPDLTYSLLRHFTGVKLRKRMVVDWRRLKDSLGSVDPLLIMRSDDEVPDAAELRRTLAYFLPQAKAVGFRRFMLVCANEINNADGWDLTRWQREGTSYILGWLQLQGSYPEVAFVSPPFMPDDPDRLAPWHEHLSGFPQKGAHIYVAWPSLYWEPAHVRNLIGGPVAVMECNQNEQFTGDRQAANLAMLEYVYGNCPEIEVICFFCGPNEHEQFGDYGLGDSESAAYRQWFQKQNGGGDVPEQTPAEIALDIIWGNLRLLDEQAGRLQDEGTRLAQAAADIRASLQTVKDALPLA